MAPYKLIISYDGTHYYGYQRQGKQRTVQLELERALREIGWPGKSILAAGRTDSGVHARGQVVSFEMDWNHGTTALMAALNAHLPDDVAVSEVNMVDVDFHPRYSAMARNYVYSIFCQPVRQPLLERYAWRVWPAVELSVLQQVASLVMGRHDFRAFGKPPRPGGRTDRNVTESRWIETRSGFFEYHLTANSFLYHMVRRLTAFQVAVAQRLADIAQFEQCLAGEGDEVVQYLAPPNGLVLESVCYEGQQLSGKPEI